MVVGTGGVRAELQRGRIALVVLAADRSPRTEDKVTRLARGRGIPILIGPPAAVLGHRLGRSTIQAVGVQDHKLAAGMLGRAAASPAAGTSHVRKEL